MVRLSGPSKFLWLLIPGSTSSLSTRVSVRARSGVDIYSAGATVIGGKRTRIHNPVCAGTIHISPVSPGLGRVVGKRLSGVVAARAPTGAPTKLLLSETQPRMLVCDGVSPNLALYTPAKRPRWVKPQASAVSVTDRVPSSLDSRRRASSRRIWFNASSGRMSQQALKDCSRFLTLMPHTLATSAMVTMSA